MTNQHIKKNRSVELDIVPFLIPSIKNIFLKMNTEILDNLEEIRLRARKPLMVFYDNGDWFVSEKSLLTKHIEGAYFVMQQEILKSMELMSENSVYAYQMKSNQVI